MGDPNRWSLEDEKRFINGMGTGKWAFKYLTYKDKPKFRLRMLTIYRDLVDKRKWDFTPEELSQVKELLDYEINRMTMRIS